MRGAGEGVWAVDAMAFDAGWRAESPEAFGRGVVARIRESAERGARVVLAPELLWLGLAQFGKAGVGEVARLFWGEVWPGMAADLPGDCLVVAGTAPWRCEESGEMRNRAVIAPEAYQDKLHLTPWEEPVFAPGRGVRLMEFGGVRVAVLICLDIEVPEIAAALRGKEVDLILVPSATETVWGFERVNRCASARAVELGCAVVVAHLTGRGPSELIDENVGGTACYLPSQGGFVGLEREEMRPREPVGSGWITERYMIDPLGLREVREGGDGETNPCRLRCGEVEVVRGEVR